MAPPSKKQTVQESILQTGLTNGLPHAGIVGMGMCVPERILTNEDLAHLVETNDEGIVTRTGIRERRIDDAQTCTSDLATTAQQRALENAGMDAADLDLV